MKKILLLAISVLALTCLFAFSVSAADSINPSTSNEYGTLTTFDEAIGNTQISNLKDDGTVARTVLTDGNGNYYTIPTVYTLVEHSKDRGNGVKGEMFNLSFGEISTKLGFTVSKNSIIRIEFPSAIKFICNGNENLSGCTNMIECVMNKGVYFWDDSDQRKVFTNCKSLKSIDVSGMVMDRAKTTFAMFEYCPELEYVKLPDAYLQADGTYMDYNTSHMFSGCNKLKTIENMEGFFKGDKTLNYKTFYNCWVLEKINLWDGLETIEGRAFGNCKAITSIVIPDTVTVIGTNETVFESCLSLKTIVLPKQVSLGSYCFEKCTALTDVWMPTEASTFAGQVFGQCGGGRAVNFYFTTAASTITINDMNNNKDPFISAITKEGDTRIKYNTPLSTKCEVFLGGHSYGDAAYSFGASLYDSVSSVSACTRRCGINVEENLGAIITEKGYSSCDIGGIKSFTRGYTVKADLLAAYEEYKGVSVEIGYVFAVATDSFDTENPTLESFAIKLPLKEQGKDLVVNGEDYNLDYIMQYKDDTRLDSFIIIAGYVLEGGNATFGACERVSYNSVAKSGNLTVKPNGSVDASVDIGSLLG